MPTAPTGNVRKHAAGYSARVRIGPKERPSFELAAGSDKAAEARALLLADLAKRLRPLAAVEEIRIIIEAAGKARTEKGLREATQAAEAIIAGETTTAAGGAAPTFADFADEWTSGKLRRKHPDHVRDKDSGRDARVLREYINPSLGPMRIPDVTLEHAERVMRRLPARLAPRSRLIVAQCMRKVLSLAVYPGRHIASNPIPREWMPKIPKSANKAKSFLYPAEDAKLIACRDVLLERRLAYGILDREGMRASELALLRWRDLDLEHGRVRLDANKTDDPRAWALSPDVARVLAWWKKRTGGEDGDRVLGDLNLAHGPRWLRGKVWGGKWHHKDDIGDLCKAGIDRAELFERSARRQPLRLHDLRATFVTVSLANGKTEQWVTDRTGHKSSQMIALYARQARTWVELNLGPMLPMDELLPEMKRATPLAGPVAPPSPRSMPRRAAGGSNRVGHERATGGVPGLSRTGGLSFRKALLYPAELRGRGGDGAPRAGAITDTIPTTTGSPSRARSRGGLSGELPSGA
jgi:integrase